MGRPSSEIAEMSGLSESSENSADQPRPFASRHLTVTASTFASRATDPGRTPETSNGTIAAVDAKQLQSSATVIRILADYTKIAGFTRCSVS